MSKIEDVYFLFCQPYCLLNCHYYGRFFRGEKLKVKGEKLKVKGEK